MKKQTIYKLGYRLGTNKERIDEILNNKIEICSENSRSTMTTNSAIYKSGTHYETISIKIF